MCSCRTRPASGTSHPTRRTPQPARAYTQPRFPDSGKIQCAGVAFKAGKPECFGFIPQNSKSWRNKPSRRCCSRSFFRAAQKWQLKIQPCESTRANSRARYSRSRLSPIRSQTGWKGTTNALGKTPKTSAQSSSVAAWIARLPKILRNSSCDNPLITCPPRTTWTLG